MSNEQLNILFFIRLLNYNTIMFTVDVKKFLLH